MLVRGLWIFIKKLIIKKPHKNNFQKCSIMFTSRFLSTRRLFSTTHLPTSAMNLFKTSCYNKVDFKISKDSTAKDAINRFTAFNIGCLAVTDRTDKIVGLLTERDYISKVASFGKSGDSAKIGDICTYGPIIVANKDDSLETCMNKMIFKDIRHLLVLDDSQECIGIISMKDVVKELMKDKNEIITRLSFFNMGKGGFFGSE